MHSPSPQLLRALRTSIIAPHAGHRPSSTLPIAGSRYPFAKYAPFELAPRRNSSDVAARPTRMVPRAHSAKPTTNDRGPESSEQTQTNFASLDVLGNVPPPTTAVDMCLADGFQLDNGTKIRNGDGVLLVGGEAFAWRPWKTGAGDGRSNATAAMVNAKGQFAVDAEEAWGLLGLVWPRPGEL